MEASHIKPCRLHTEVGASCISAASLHMPLNSATSTVPGSVADIIWAFIAMPQPTASVSQACKAAIVSFEHPAAFVRSIRQYSPVVSQFSMFAFEAVLRHLSKSINTQELALSRHESSASWEAAVQLVFKTEAVPLKDALRAASQESACSEHCVKLPEIALVGQFDPSSRHSINATL
jgi:hypothetical protein